VSIKFQIIYPVEQRESLKFETYFDFVFFMNGVSLSSVPCVTGFTTETTTQNNFWRELFALGHARRGESRGRQRFTQKSTDRLEDLLVHV